MKRCRKTISMLLVCSMLSGMIPASMASGVERKKEEDEIITSVSVEENFGDGSSNYAVTDDMQLYTLTQEVSGTCGENLIWTLNTDGVLTISGTGEMTDYVNGRLNSECSSPWYRCEEIISVVIDTGVSSIGDYAFHGCLNLTSVVIPDSVTSIGNGAFLSCDNLKSVTIPNGVTSIGSESFYGCTSLTSITIPESITAIPYEGFAYCYGLKYVTIPNSVTVIEPWAFVSCNSLTSVTIPNKVTTIGDGAFRGCDALTSVNIPDSVSSIGTYAFADCTNLKGVTIPGNVTDFGEYVFFSCKNLTNVKIQEGITTIGDYAFNNCSSLPHVTIPESVTSIGVWAFSLCNSLTEVVIPSSVSTIGDGAFRYCTGLKEVTIPKCVTDIGDAAFEECTALKNVYYSGTKRQWIRITTGKDNEYLQNAELHCKEAGPDEVPVSGVMLDRDNLTLEGIGTEERLVATVLPTDAYEQRVIWSSDDSNIARVKDGVVTSVSEGKTRITATTLEGGYEVSCDVTVYMLDVGGDNVRAAGYCGGEGDGRNLLWILTSDNTLTISGTGKMKDYLMHIVGPDDMESEVPDEPEVIPPWYNSWDDYGVAVRNLVIENNVTSIGNYAFSGCSLTDVTISDSVKSIGEGAFINCEYLPSITIPEGVVEIGDRAFVYCNSLSNVTMSEGLTTIGDLAFKYCWNLTNISIPDSVTTIGVGAFMECFELMDIVIPEGVTRIEDGTFYRCENLKNVKIPQSVKIIENSAFYMSYYKPDIYYFGTREQWDNITIYAYNDPIQNGTLHFLEEIPVSEIILDRTSLTLEGIESTEQLIAIVLPENATNKNVIWTSDNPEIATVVDGVVTAISEGMATITATTEDGGFNATCEVSVEINQSEVAVTGVCLDQSVLILNALGESARLTATVLPEAAADKRVTWSSGDESVVTVDDGVVTAISEGTATITATTEDGGFNATCEVSVEINQSEVAVTGITLDASETYWLSPTEPMRLTAFVLPADATNKQVTWSSSDESVVTVDDGVVTAIANGFANITATTKDGGFTATCSITVDMPLEVDGGFVVIRSANELYNQLYKNSAGMFKLGNDIDLSSFKDGCWVPIGSKTKPFTGILYGDGHTIKNLNLSRGGAYSGLFGCTSGADIRDLNLEISNGNVGTGNTYKGGVSGYDTGSTIVNVTVSGQTIKGGSATLTWAYYSSCVGGLVGCASADTLISDSHNLCNVYARGYWGEAAAGGITGSGGTILKSSNNGKIALLGTPGDGYGGGISGRNSKISECYNVGDVAVTVNAGWYGYAGGIIGYKSYSAKGIVINSYNEGEVSCVINGSSTGKYVRVGAISGDQDVTIDSCYSIGEVSSNASNQKKIKYYISSNLGVDEESMTQVSSYKGFDFKTIWEKKVTENYPTLVKNPPDHNVCCDITILDKISMHPIEGVRIESKDTSDILGYTMENGTVKLFDSSRKFTTSQTLLFEKNGYDSFECSYSDLETGELGEQRQMNYIYMTPLGSDVVTNWESQTQMFIDQHILFFDNQFAELNDANSFYNVAWKEENGKRLWACNTWEVLGDIGEVMSLKFDDLSFVVNNYDVFVMDLLLTMTDNSFNKSILARAEDSYHKAYSALTENVVTELCVAYSKNENLLDIHADEEVLEEIKAVLKDKKKLVQNFEWFLEDKSKVPDSMKLLYENFFGKVITEKDLFSSIFSGLNLADAMADVEKEIADTVTDISNAYILAAVCEEINNEIFIVLYQTAEKMSSDESEKFKECIGKYQAIANDRMSMMKYIRDAGFIELGFAAYNIAFKDIFQDVLYEIIGKTLGISFKTISLAYNGTYVLLDYALKLNSKTELYNLMYYAANVEKALSSTVYSYGWKLKKDPTVLNAKFFETAFEIMQYTNKYLYEAAYKFGEATNHPEDMQYATYYKTSGIKRIAMAPQFQIRANMSAYNALWIYICMM